jgi:hypothetical protein
MRRCLDCTRARERREPLWYSRQLTRRRCSFLRLLGNAMQVKAGTARLPIRCSADSAARFARHEPSASSVPLARLLRGLSSCLSDQRREVKSPKDLSVCGELWHHLASPSTSFVLRRSIRIAYEIPLEPTAYAYLNFYHLQTVRRLMHNTSNTTLYATVEVHN